MNEGGDGLVWAVYDSYDKVVAVVDDLYNAQIFAGAIGGRIELKGDLTNE